MIFAHYLHHGGRTDSAVSVCCALIPFNGEILGATGPVVDSIQFSTNPLPGDTTLGISAEAVSDPTTAIDSVRFTIVGVSAGNLVNAGRFQTIPSQPAAIESALAAILDENKDFISLIDQPGQPTTTPGELVIGHCFT